VTVPAASFKAGLALPPLATLDVHVVRTVQATDPNPSLFFSTFVFSTVPNGVGGTTESATASATVSIFKPSVKITLGVNKTTASVGTILTYTVTITNTSTSNSPNLRFNVQSGTETNQLISGVNRGVVSGLTDTSHMFAGESVWGPGIQKGTTILTVNSPTQVTLNKTTGGGFNQLYFGFGPMTVPPPLGFVLPGPALATLSNFSPGSKVTFSYTHQIVSGDPNPLKNTFDMYFFVVSNLQSHPVAYPNKIHGPSNTVSTTSLLSKTMFF